MEQKNKTATPSNNEIAVINQVIFIFAKENMTYKEAISTLVHVEGALNEIAINGIVRSHTHNQILAKEF